VSWETGCGRDFFAFDGVEVFCANCCGRETDDCVECFAEESHFNRKDWGDRAARTVSWLCGEMGQPVSATGCP
jgi:hypothetical protein